MKILVYTPWGNPSADRLSQALDEVIPGGAAEVHRQVTSFVQRLRMPSSDLDMLILMPANRQELLAVSVFLSRPPNLRLVLILPDRDKETIAMAHTLRPRFVTYANGNYSELREVLKKMLSDVPSIPSKPAGP
ncbi:MAG TPA: hypothetical protein VMM57_00415 [Bacteroidota bacterium]|nr:hypothetical protein [Bacteroidota bacterium]